MLTQTQTIRVIHSFPTWLPQTQTWMYNQVQYLPDWIDNHVVCERTENLDQFWLPAIHSLAQAPVLQRYWDLGLRKLRLRRHLSFLEKQAKQHQVNIIHSHFGNVGWANLGAVRGSGARHVVTFYGQDISRLPKLDPRWYKRYRTLFEQVACVLCEGPHMAQRVVELGCPEHKARVHHLGIEIQNIPFKPRTWQPGEQLCVLIAASFQEKKGIPYALEALGRVNKEIPVDVTVIGDASREERSQREKEKILETVAKYDLQSNVRFMGYQTHKILMRESYKHQIFLSPSLTAGDGDTEGGAPVTLIEMAASGMPIVSTRHCDIPEVIQNGTTGLLADERNVNNLVNHLKWLINHPLEWNQMLEAGRQYVEKEFDASKQGERLAAIYSGVAGIKR